MVNLETMRKEFGEAGKDEKNLSADPFVTFKTWFDKAFAVYGEETNSFVLATCKKDGTPSSRVVLLKGIENQKMTFFTNYLSDKAEEIAHCPEVSCNFYWPKIECQVRILAKAEKLSHERNQKYFALRPREARLGAWASKQSHAIDSRQDLLDSYKEYESKFKEGEVPCPDFWGGYDLSPYCFEFWWGRSNRLHDRIRYSEGENKGFWMIERLAP